MNTNQFTRMSGVIWVLLVHSFVLGDAFIPRSSDLFSIRLVREDLIGRQDKSFGQPSIVQSIGPLYFSLANFFTTNSKSIDDDALESDVLSSNSTAMSIEQAERLLLRAQELKAEAEAMELALEASKSSKIKEKEAEAKIMIDRIFPKSDEPLSAETVAERLDQVRLSDDQLVSLLDFLYKRRKIEFVKEQEMVKNQTLTDAGKGKQEISHQNSTISNQTESELLSKYIQYLADAALIIDEKAAAGEKFPLMPRRRLSGSAFQLLNSRLSEWRRSEEKDFERRLAIGVQTALKANNKNATVQDYISKSLGLTSESPQSSVAQGAQSAVSGVSMNVSNVVERVALVPMWVPSSLLGFVISSRTKFDAVDIRSIKEKVLSRSRFFCTSSDSISCAAVFRGNIRATMTPTSSPPPETAQERRLCADVFKEIQEEMDKQGLSKKIQLFMLEDPEWRPDTGERKPKPVILALPKTVKPDSTKVRETAISLLVKQASVVLTLIATFAYSVSCYALNPNLFDAIVNKQDLKVVLACLPVFGGVLGIQIIHELAHFIVARKRGMKIGYPLPLPSSQLGTFGSITPLRSFPPNRSALLDFSLSGPMTAILVSTLLMIAGTLKTMYASQAALRGFPVIPVAMLKSSFIAGSILTYLLPKAMMLPLSQPVPIHPLFLIGFSGLVASALNLLPIFRLDGGRACTAAVGPRVSAITSAWTLLCLLSFALSGSGLAWTWGALVLFFQRRQEIPARDDVTRVNDVRLGVWVGSLVTAVLALAPFPGAPGIL